MFDEQDNGYAHALQFLEHFLLSTAKQCSKTWNDQILRYLVNLNKDGYFLNFYFEFNAAMFHIKFQGWQWEKLNDLRVSWDL